MTQPNDLKGKIIILGVKIDDFSQDFVLKKCQSFLADGRQHKIFTPNPEICLKAEADEHYRSIINNADINIPDGFGLKLGAKILRQNLKNRVTGADLTRKLLDFADANNLRVFVLLRTDSLTREEDLDQFFANQYKKIQYLSAKINQADIQNREVVEKINKLKPQILFCCLGAPYQERWINENLQKIPAVKLALGVGGSFDFLTGKIKRAPKIMQELGVEWLYRLYQEPKRLARVKHAIADFLLHCHHWQKRIELEFRTNVVAIIKNKEGKFLIQKNPRLDNHWQFPQGGIEEGEDIETAAVREASEELGLAPGKLKSIKILLGEHQYIWSNKQRQLLHGYKGQMQKACLLNFLGDDKDFDFSASHEVEAIKWVEKDDLMNSVHPIRREFLKKLIPFI